MHELEPFDDELRRLLRESHRHDPPPPSFRRQWRHATRHSEPRADENWWRLSLPSVITTVGVAAALILALAGARVALDGSLTDDPHAAAMTRVGAFEPPLPTPLDFLLQTPGAELLGTTPTLGGPTALDSFLTAPPQEN